MWFKNIYALVFTRPKMASLNDGLELCAILREILSPLHLYPALTGGLLYKRGRRKDIDIVIYRNRQEVDGFEIDSLHEILSESAINITGFHGFVTKAKWKGFTVDLFNPETNTSEIPYGNT